MNKKRKEQVDLVHSLLTAIGIPVDTTKDGDLVFGVDLDQDNYCVAVQVDINSAQNLCTLHMAPVVSSEDGRTSKSTVTAQETRRDALAKAMVLINYGMSPVMKWDMNMENGNMLFHFVFAAPSLDEDPDDAQAKFIAVIHGAMDFFGLGWKLLSELNDGTREDVTSEDVREALNALKTKALLGIISHLAEDMNSDEEPDEE